MLRGPAELSPRNVNDNVQQCSTAQKETWEKNKPRACVYISASVWERGLRNPLDIYVHWIKMSMWPNVLGSSLKTIH